MAEGRPTHRQSRRVRDGGAAVGAQRLVPRLWLENGGCWMDGGRHHLPDGLATDFGRQQGPTRYSGDTLHSLIVGGNRGASGHRQVLGREHGPLTFLVVVWFAHRLRCGGSLRRGMEESLSAVLSQLDSGVLRRIGRERSLDLVAISATSLVS